MEASDSWESFSALVQRLKTSVDVLIQHSENYYVMSELLESRSQLPGGKSFGLLRQAVGFEIVNRIYRLTDKGSDSYNFGALKSKYLENEINHQVLFPSFNYDGRKENEEFNRFINNSIKLIRDIYDSSELKKVRIFRQRYTAHMIPMPRDLDRFGPDADVDELSSADLRKLAEGMAGVLDMVRYLSERSEFPFEEIAKMARSEALDLWC